MHGRLLPFLLIIGFLSASSIGLSQQVTIQGQVYHRDDPTFNLLIVNKNTSKGIFGNADGSFTVQAKKNDTILVGALGYQTTPICMRDSVDKDTYNVKIFLTNISKQLREVEVFPRRDLDSIQRDIRRLGYDERDYMITGIDAMSSPLTYLYQQVSRKERMKRRAYEIINADKKRELLKQLFIQYVDYDIIDLEPSEFDDFIDFMNVSDDMLMQMTQYDFVIYTKRRFAQYRQLPPRLRQDINTHD